MARRESYSIHERRIEALRVKDKSTDDRQVMDEVFDKETLLAIYKLMTDKIIETVELPISTGKEGNVFLCTSPEKGLLALKIYRISNSTFKRISRYIEGDPRFKGLTGSHRKTVFAWATKEFRNLQRLEKAGVRVPSPIRSYRNLLAMEYIGTEEAPAPQMRDVKLKNPERTYKTLVKFVKLAYKKAELVHGDLSEYNVLMQDDKPILIDCGQAMMTDHPNALEFLRRDIVNLNRYFRSIDVDVIDPEELFQMVTGGAK
ncbi:MAG: serine protein kinase RIO [Methanomassiliicoccales archaeon]|nr:serine protein kinase RIO [Methanomassiliicoccales archaeon]